MNKSDSQNKSESYEKSLNKSDLLYEDSERVSEILPENVIDSNSEMVPLNRHGSLNHSAIENKFKDSYTNVNKNGFGGKLTETDDEIDNVGGVKDHVVIRKDHETKDKDPNLKTNDQSKIANQRHR